jgi:UDP-N-acetylglucosamine--N-acetylmuramyl-(pentapeptide) pyrophosphoryl-undecaprenol N-acetylglucosamine transferase
VAEDHQTKNAQAIADRRAALYISESDLDVSFKEVFAQLLQAEGLRAELSKNIRALAKTAATSDIVDELEKLLP